MTLDHSFDIENISAIRNNLFDSSDTTTTFFSVLVFYDTHFFASQSRFNANLKLWWWVDWLVDDAEDKIGLQQIFTWRMFCVFTQVDVDVGVGVGVGVGNASSQGRRDAFFELRRRRYGERKDVRLNWRQFLRQNDFFWRASDGFEDPSVQLELSWIED